jgi:hypothetical protein
MNREEGAVGLGAVIALFFLSALFAGSVLLMSVNTAYSTRNSFESDERVSADALLDEIIASMQPLANYEYDDYNNPLLEELKKTYTEYNLDFLDVSSGYHPDFLSDDDLQDQRLREFLFPNNDAAGFTAFRDRYGLSDNKAAWRSYIKEDAFSSCVSYGWIHRLQTETFAYRTVSASYAASSPEDLFPLVNDFPLMNVNMIDPDIIIPLIMRPSFRIEKPAEKAEALKNKLLHGSVLVSDISSCLNIPRDHPLFVYLGTKTAFWKITFEYRRGMYLEAVAAAIPEKDGSFQEIARYALIDRSIRYER